MKKTRHLAIVLVAIAIVLCIGAVGAYASMANDETAPVTTSDVATSYAGDVNFQISSSDAGGVAYLYHRFDKGVARLLTVATDTVHPAVELSVPLPLDAPLALGTHTVKFWAQDLSGNVEAQNTVNFTVSPALTLTRSASVVSARKYFTLSGTLKPAKVGVVVVQAKKPGASAFKTLANRSTDASGMYAYRYRTTSKGTWSFRTQFTDGPTALSALSPIVKVRVK